MELMFNIYDLKWILSVLAIISGIFVISTKNAVISIFNLIVLYILVAFYLIYIGITYLGISYIVVYIGAIAILFLFVIMMIDIEVLEIKSNNYIPLLFILLLSFLIVLKNILYSLGLVKIKSANKVSQSELIINDKNLELFNLRYINSIVINNYSRSHENDNMKEIEIEFNAHNNDSIIFQEYYSKFSEKKNEISLEFIPDNNS
jgi:NADH-ubiquinone oxidoreductase chain 6